MSKSLTDPLAELKKEHAAVYQQFRPHLKEYSRLAADVLRLQVDIVKASFAQELSTVPVEKVLVCKISARETLENVTRALETLKTASILEVVYDPSRFEFLVFGKA